MKYLWIVSILFASSAGAAEGWICAYEIKNSEDQKVSRVEDFMVVSDLETTLVKKAFATARGTVMAEVAVEKNAKGKSEIFPKLKFGMDRMPSASMPTWSSEATLKIVAEKNQPALDVKLSCARAK